MQGKAAKLLQSRRNELNLTQHEVAVRAGIRDYDVSRWERGATKTLPLAGMAKICRVLNLDLEVLADALLADEEGFSSGGSGGAPGGSPPVRPREHGDQAASRAAERGAAKPRRRRSEDDPTPDA